MTFSELPEVTDKSMEVLICNLIDISIFCMMMNPQLAASKTVFKYIAGSDDGSAPREIRESYSCVILKQ